MPNSCSCGSSSTSTRHPARLRVIVLCRCVFKKGRTGPYGDSPSVRASRDAEAPTKLERGQAYLGFMLSQSLKSGNGSRQAVSPKPVNPKSSGQRRGSAPRDGASDPPAPTQEKEPTQLVQRDEEDTTPTVTSLSDRCWNVSWQHDS